MSAQTFGLFTYTVYGNSITITDYPISATGVVEIPSTIDGKSVTKIGDSAFAGCVSIVSVDIPAGVTSIGQYTFYGCSSLTGVDIPAGVTSIGQYTFYGCSSLTSVVIPASAVLFKFGAIVEGS